MSDLDKLIEAVEAGDCGGNSAALINDRIARRYHDKGGYWPSNDVMKAYDGSLDAAKTLHEALLPGWEWDVSWVGAMVGGPDALIPETSEVEFYVDNAEKPARAWLLAVLKAYRSLQ